MKKNDLGEVVYPSFVKPKNYNFQLKSWLKRNHWVSIGTHVEFPLQSKILGTPTEIKDGVYINGPMVIKGSGKVSIGKYSIIAENFRVISSNHRIDRADMQGKFTVPSDISKGPVYIGNNVWCGDNVTVLSGVTIGDGAVIGAGSVVTRDIPPFSVAVGAPTKVIKFRFSKKTIEKLQDISWWHLEHKTIINNKDFFSTIINDETINYLDKKVDISFEKEVAFLKLSNYHSSRWLLNGWGKNENEGRWAEKNEASFIFKTLSTEKYKYFVFLAYSYYLPQKIRIFINRNYISKVEILNRRSEYKIDASKFLKKGVNTIRIVFSKSFSPMDVEKKSADNRNLFCFFSWFKLLS